ncbi:unnamed protein product, partial [Alternaria alternata]
GNWVLQTLNYIRDKSLHKIVAKKESEDQWKTVIWKIANASLLPSVDSWYMGANVSGKIREPLIYFGGVPSYYEAIRKETTHGYPGFDLS